MPKKEKCDIYFHNFDKKKINEGGWKGEEGKLYLDLTFPLKGKSIKVLDESIEKNKFKYIGNIELDYPEQSVEILQNITEDGHPLNKNHKVRSMMVGDIVVCGNQGKLVESEGWSNLSETQIKKLTKLKK